MNTTSTTIGFLGVGSISRAMVAGLLTGDSSERPQVVLSPRGTATVARLKQEFPQVTVVSSNADVVAQSDVVVLAVRPDQLDEALDGVKFHPGQTVVSVLAGVLVDTLRAAIGHDDIPVARAIPLPPVAEHAIVVPVTPPLPAALALFDRMGGAFPVEDEKQLAVLSAVTGSCTGLLQYVRTLCDWSVFQGLDRLTMEPFIRGMVASLSPALQDPAETMDEVVASHETPGGLNEQLRTEFFDPAGTKRLFGALDHIHARATGSDD